VRRARFALLVLALLAVLSVIGPSVAVADSCNGSAGDTQYFDPLAPCNSQTTPSGSTTPATTTPGGSTTTTPPVTAALASTTTTTKDPKKSLPFTGLDLGPAVLIGVVLLGGGVALRRAVARGETS
jgi:hypothetical protein